MGEVFPDGNAETIYAFPRNQDAYKLMSSEIYISTYAI
jgi:hypothetical protein